MTDLGLKSALSEVPNEKQNHGDIGQMLNRPVVSVVVANILKRTRKSTPDDQYKFPK